MIHINGVTKKYNGVTALADINCAIEKGSILGLVGYNGAGKTTLLKLICGVLTAEQGEITLDGKHIYDNAELKSRIFFLSDDPYIFPQANMRKMADFYRGYYKKWNEALFLKLTSIFGLDLNKRISSFSKGMQRQAAIIFGLSASPDYLLMDEAFDGIDPMMRDLVRQLLLETIAERESGIVISSHNLRELEDLCDRVAILNGKRIVYNAMIDDMRANKNKYRIAFAKAVTEEGFFDKIGRGLDITYKNFKQSQDGKVITFIAEGNADAFIEKMQTQKPLLLEKIPLSLEEIFLIEMEAKTYDFTDLFK